MRTPCGTNTVTTTELARSSTECVVLPGYGWASGNNAALCPVGFYNPGYNTRTCSRCPGGLTTAGPGANSTQDCVAPAGAGRQNMHAEPPASRGEGLELRHHLRCNATSPAHPTPPPPPPMH